MDSSRAHGCCAFKSSSDKLEEHRCVNTVGHCSLGHQRVIYEIIIWISRLALLSFGPAIVGSLFLKPSLLIPLSIPQ